MKIQLCLIMLLLGFNTANFAQQKKNIVSQPVIIEPIPKGGWVAFDKFINDNLKYPKEAETAGVEGAVTVNFTVTKSGQVRGVSVEKSLHPLLDEEAIGLVLISDKALDWVPGQKNGKRQSMRHAVTIEFALPETEIEIEISAPIPVWESNDDTDIDMVMEIPVDGTNLNKQTEEQVYIFDIVEEEAQPIGGMTNFYESIAKNLEYPKQAQRLGIEGTAYVRFIVDEKGNVASAEIVDGRELGYGMDEEAIRLIKQTKWVPGKQRGKAVLQRKILPVRFKLPKE